MRKIAYTSQKCNRGILFRYGTCLGAVVRAAFLALSLVFAVAVLLAHIHYSIDVFAAPFMAYGIFTIASRLFPKDYALMVR